MTAFPSGSGNHIPTDNLNQSTDKPKDAREDLLELVQRVNTIIDSFNANSGICGLTSGGKVDSAKLVGQIDTTQLVSDAVDGTKIADDSIDSEHIVDGSVDKVHTSFISQSTIDNTATNDVVPTQLAVKSFVDTAVAGSTGDMHVQEVYVPSDGSTATLTVTQAGNYIVHWQGGNITTTGRGTKYFSIGLGYGGSNNNIFSVGGTNTSMSTGADWNKHGFNYTRYFANCPVGYEFKFYFGSTSTSTTTGSFIQAFKVSGL